jgi:hypothetical protein
MASQNKKNFDGFLGKSGGYTTYLLNGKVVRRQIGVSTKPPTLKQLEQRQKGTLSNELNKPVKEFIKLGFDRLAVQRETIAHALMTSNTLAHAIKGEYPNFEIDYPKVLFSKGQMPLTPGLKVRLHDDVLEFEWEQVLKPGVFRNDDQIMLVIYFPEEQDAEFSVCAGPRGNGRTDYRLVQTEVPRIMEIYASFIAADRKSISDSMYLGQMVLPALANN